MFLRLLTLLFFVLSLPSCYVLQQAAGQLSMFVQRRPLALLANDPSLTTRQRDRLTIVWHARQFALRELGLNASESFQHVVLLPRDSVSYVVAAAPADRLEPYRWCFPVAGCLPYIGYFSRADAVRERDRLRALGYDTQLRGVEAYSLGGWFPDPVYSPLLQRSRASVANVVIHELTHGTIFVPSQARFNESLATFVGDRGSVQFLAQRYGVHSHIYRETLALERDGHLWEGALRQLATQLRTLYATNLSREEKLRRKATLIAETRTQLGNMPFETSAYRRRAGLQELNNATLATFATYFGDQELLEEAFRLQGSDLRSYLVFLRREVAPRRDPAGWLRRWIQEHTTRR